MQEIQDLNLQNIGWDARQNDWLRSAVTNAFLLSPAWSRFASFAVEYTANPSAACSSGQAVGHQIRSKKSYERPCELGSTFKCRRQEV